MPRQEPASATTALKNLIVERSLMPGDPLPPETELADLLGFSRPSLREAIRSLVALDILQVRHGRGTYVGAMSLQPMVDTMVFRGVLTADDGYTTLREVVQLRTTLDLAMAEEVVAHLGGTQDDRLLDLTAQMKESATRGETFEVADRAFHLALTECQSNALFKGMVGALWDIHSMTSPRLGLPSSRDMLDTANAHTALLERAFARDVEGYRAAVLAHYEPLLRVLQRKES